MKLNNIGQGGHKFRMDDMVHLQTGVIDCLKALSKTVGNNIPGNANYFILDGAIITQSGGSTFITDGWIYWNGEICPITNNLPTGIPVTSNNAYFHLKTTVTPYPGYPDSGSPGAEVKYQNGTYHDVHIFNEVVLNSTALDGIPVANIPRISQYVGNTPQGGVIAYSGPSTNFYAPSDASAGTIPIGYAVNMGKLGSQVDGWAISDGGTYNSFLTPDLTGRFILGQGVIHGAGGYSSFITAGKRSGTAKTILTIGNLPKHTHAAHGLTFTGALMDAHTHTLTIYGVGGPNTNHLLANSVEGVPPGTSGELNEISSVSAGTPSGTIGGQTEDGTAAGLSAEAFDIMPPYYALIWIVKY